MKRFFTIALLFSITLVNAQAVFINELHYDNTGGDTGEFVEIAGPSGTDLTGWTVVLYNGSNNSTYETINLAGTIPNEINNFGALAFFEAGIQNGAPDGLALVDDMGSVIQFLSYEGSFTASNGPASGMMSEDIGVSESSSTPVGESLQLIGSGTMYADFTWIAPSPASPGALNAGQVFPLPISLTSFQAETERNNVLLTWETESEHNNDFFSIEHSSDGKAFKEVGKVIGAGWSTSIESYDFTHEYLKPGSHYYRLRQVDFDGRYEYSNVISVEVYSNGLEFLVYPTSTSNTITIEIPNNSSEETTLEIFNTSGQQVYTQVIGGKGLITVDVSDLISGTYFVRISDGNQYSTGNFFRF